MSDSPPPAQDLDLKLVRCFTVVAEHRHFGRAATALHLTASSLSRQISRLELLVGAQLLDRTPQGSRLTEAGEVFLPLATALLRSAHQATARARAAAQPARITIGYIANIIVTPAVRELRRRHPDAEVRSVHLPWNEPRAALLDHRVDVAVARLPFPTDELHVTVLYDEPRALLVPLDHRLVGKKSVTLDDIADEPLSRTLAPMWNAFWRVDPRPDGRPAPDGPLIEGTVEDKIQLIAGGQAVAIVPAGARINGLRPDLTTIPLEGVEPSHVVLATRAGDRGRLVTAFRRYAEAHLTASDPGRSEVGPPA
ncbi:DNA-binding transcriptional LysR family regulator [Streptomyces sp. Ag82_O1-15]|uniref:LysR family transcriptional regulator n=1 Tax=Streptomyces sp. Ag82_O1-15 TaxID=1938855 RepID=UPI000BB14EB6|nr:LysR family transcriptional regulator [Streptomyces sp. Ag82_O1-15]PBD01837.1 DNA-binding transcriptional LysR family regulator [Streptomyces sp. Ag82_O1-15]